jgi:hypothetical protein
LRRYIEEEQRDKDREKRIHKEFSGFCRKVQDIWEKDFPAGAYTRPFLSST